jgi:hypothetical protein
MCEVARRLAIALGFGVTLAGLAIGYSQAGTTAPTASGSDHVVPRFTLDATTAIVDDEVSLRVAQVPRLSQREIRLYLLQTAGAASVRSRLDPRLSFIGTVRASRNARLIFTVPPLEAGRYALAYWCSGCLPRGEKIGLQSSPKLSVTTPVGDGCPTTEPNGNVPPGAPKSWYGLPWHGNGGLWVPLRPDGTLVTNALGGWKQLWVAKNGVSGRLGVRYGTLEEQAEPVAARTGFFSGDERPNSTMSQMSFRSGCWQITGRLGDASLSFVVSVVLGSS